MSNSSCNYGSSTPENHPFFFDTSAVIAEFLAAINAAGLEFSGQILPDAGLQRFKVNGDKAANSWYVLHTDGIAAGIFGCNKRGVKQTWCAKGHADLSSDERAERDRKWQQQQRERDADRRRQNDEASTRAAAILEAAHPATNEHPYLVKKSVKAAPGVMTGSWLGKPNCLLIPLRTASGQLATVQAISPDAPFTHSGQSKDFLKGGAKAGAYFVIGDLNTAERVVIAEGYATAATLYEATGYPSVMACDAGNLKPVAEALHALYPNARIIIAADDDRATEGNPGLTKATQAAKAVKADLAVPHFEEGEPGTDFNDLADMHGLEAVKAAIGKAGLVGKADTHKSKKQQEAKQGLLVREDGKGLLKHNAASIRLYQHEFNSNLYYDPIQLDWYQYNESKGFFERRPALAIEQAVDRAVNRHCGGIDFDASYPSGVTRSMLLKAIQQPTPVSGKICFTNGVLDLATRELLPHSPDFQFTSSLPYPWIPDAAPPKLVIDWLLETVGGHADQVQLLRAYLNAVVIGRPDLQRFLEIIGAGGSGKGTFIRLAQALVGKEGFHPTALKQLEENRFESAKLFGKKLIIITDAEKWHGDVSMLKSLTGQDSIRFEEKHKQAGESFVFGGMVIIGANQHTESTDYSSGIQRRRITVPFDHVVSVDKKRDLEAEFEPLLPAILKWVLDMPQQEVTAYLRSTSLHTASLKEARILALHATNPLAGWMLDNVEFGENLAAKIGVKTRVTITEKEAFGPTTSQMAYRYNDEWLYPNYCQWCDENGKKQVSKNLFSTSVVDTARNTLGKSFVSYDRKNSGRRIIGMRLKGQESCQPVTTSDNLVTTQVIDCAEDDNLYIFSEVNEFLNSQDESQSAASFVADEVVAEKTESGESCEKVPLGCHFQHNQQDRLSPVDTGLTPVDTVPTLGRHADSQPTPPPPAATPAPATANPLLYSPLASRIRQRVKFAGSSGVADKELERMAEKAGLALYAATLQAVALADGLTRCNGRWIAGGAQ